MTSVKRRLVSDHPSSILSSSAISGRIIAIETRHPFVVSESNGWQVVLKPACKGCLACTEVSVNQVGGCHTDILHWATIGGFQNEVRDAVSVVI
jgi:hypothetical protein